MAYIDDLVASISDPALRRSLAIELAKIKERTNFGLVFERHIPEMGVLAGLRPRKGSVVAFRSEQDRAFLVESVNRSTATVRELKNGSSRQAKLSDMLVLAELGRPIYPALTSVGVIEQNKDRPFHTVINAENYHALQLFTYSFAGQVDCIYIDPPYNTGARDWKYNNHYVDRNDAWRHSKWLASMERRLRLAARLLRADGVLIVTVDANEVHHLGLLLEQLFPSSRRQVVSICINPSGASGEGLSRVDEYAFFCFFGQAEPLLTADDMLSPGEGSSSNVVAWESLLRRGNVWYRAMRPNLCYPVVLDPKGHRIVGVGEPFAGKDEKRRPQSINGKPVAWPVRSDGRLGIWRVDGRRLLALAKEGYAAVTSRDDERGTWTIRYVMTGTIKAIETGAVKVTGKGPRGDALLEQVEARRFMAKTMWHRGRHTAGGAGGTQMLTALLGERGAFPFPKSVYAVRDCLQIAVGNRPDALILDFFAGSGTTMHAAALMNLDDGGRRRTVMVTNNEVGEEEDRALRKSGIYPGDAAYEARGIFERVTQPRVAAAVTGLRSDRSPAEGQYLDGRQLAEGLDENVEFFKLEFLDKDSVELGHAFEAINPCLWLMSGARGSHRIKVDSDGWAIADGGSYAVLFDETRLRSFAQALKSAPSIERVFLVTDSEEAYAEMAEALGGRWPTSMLYRDYLRNFQINIEETQ